MAYRLRATVITNVGKVRRNNEDNFYLFGDYKEDVTANVAAINTKGTTENEVAAVFDGMGGEEAGEIASLLAASGLASVMEGNWEEQIKSQLSRLNERVCNEIKKRGGVRMGTTFAGVYFDDDKAICANVGDSRCYMMRDGVLYRMSYDHSEAQKLINQGVLTEEEARKSQDWHVLSQCLGVFPSEITLDPYLSPVVELQERDRFMLCSDGLTDIVMDDRIAELLSAGDSAEAVTMLVNTALDNGGYDNVTVIVIDVYRMES